MNYNFGAGPAMLPSPVMQQIHDEWFNWQQQGLSAIGWSHRAKCFEPMIHETNALIRELLSIPENYRILFLQGGASLQWSLLPMNVAWGESLGFVLTGLWSEKAYHEGKKYSQAKIVGNSQHQGRFTDIVDPQQWAIPDDVHYVHYASNETVQGIQFSDIPNIAKPLVCDMSSDILSRPIPIERYGAIYAGAQKNMGVAGLTVLIIREDWLNIESKNKHWIPATLNFHQINQNHSMLNTPCTFAIYACNLVCQWLKALGGVRAIEKRNHSKAALLYDYLDQSCFYETTIAKRARSQMNVTFRLRDESYQQAFLEQSDATGLKQLKGHRLQGGIRASIYNAMPREGVERLINFMDDFAKRNT